QVECGLTIKYNIRLHDSDLSDVSVFNFDMGVTEFTFLTGAEAFRHGFLCPFPLCQCAEHPVCLLVGDGQSGKSMHRKSMVPVPMGDKDSLGSREIRRTDCVKHRLQMRRRVACINQHAVVTTVDVSEVRSVAFFVEGQNVDMGRDLGEHIYQPFVYVHSNIWR